MAAVFYLSVIGNGGCANSGYAFWGQQGGGRELASGLPGGAH